jgi:hypothetical protein
MSGTQEKREKMINKIGEIKKELLEVLKEYCQDHNYAFRSFAGMSDWVDKIEKTAYNRGYNDGVLATIKKPRPPFSLNIEVTNRDWLIRNLKQMSDREFAKVFCESTGCSSCPSGGISAQCTDKLIDWLKQEHKEGRQ